MYQIDSSESMALDQIGNIEGQEDSQDSEAEFDLKKHKATLLFSQRLNEKVTISAYEEVIFKTGKMRKSSPSCRMHVTTSCSCRPSS